MSDLIYGVGELAISQRRPLAVVVLEDEKRLAPVGQRPVIEQIGERTPTDNSATGHKLVQTGPLAGQLLADDAGTGDHVPQLQRGN